MLLLMVAVTLTVGYAAGQEGEVSKISYTLEDDFETGELFGWEPYPYAEDIGFDALFFTQTSPTYNNSKYALARPVRANDIVELYHGFTKRLNLWTTSESRLQAAVYFQSDRNPAKLELSLGTFDGRRYRHTIENPEANQWLELDIPMEAFKLNGQSLAAGEHLQVVTLEASYPMVYYLYTYTVLMDDFKLNGERQRRFIGIEPASSDFDMFDISVLNKHFFYGDNVALTVTPEGDVPLRQVSGTLVDSEGKVVKDNIRFSGSNNGWVSNAIHKFKKEDARGQWQIRLTGQTEQDTEVRWSFTFLMPGEPVDEHPRLFFSEEELAERLANEQSAVAKNILTNVLEDTAFMQVDIEAIEEGADRTAENLVGGPYSKTSVGFNAFGKWRNPMVKLGKVIEEGSFRYAFTGDQAAGEKAKKALLRLCSFKKWNADWMLERKFWTYYPVGYTLLPVAYGYDMLQDLLSEEEQKMVREAIMEKGLKLFLRDMVEMNRMPSNLTNHIAVLVGGHGLAAAVIYGEDEENPYLEPYLSGIMTKAKIFIDRTYHQDGSYAEPFNYQSMASRSIVEMLATFERNFGVNWATTTNVKNFYLYPIYATHQNKIKEHSGSLLQDLQSTHTAGAILDFGDAGRTFDGFTQIHSEYFVHRTGNPFLYQYVKPYWEEGNGGYLGYLWYRDDITPVSRENLPSSRVFEAQGMVMRSGWEDSSTVISIRFGPHSNHYHFDQGSFQIMTNGEVLLDDPGVGPGGYYENLNFNVYNIQAIAHNVMLVDHDAESQKPAHFDNDIAALRDWPRMVHTFAGEIADAVEGDLTSVYKDKLDSYTRTLLYTKSGSLFLFDQVKSKSSDGHVYDWLFHAMHNSDGRSISYSNNRMTVDRPNARLTMDVLSPEITTAQIRDAAGAARGGESLEENFITLTSKPNLQEVNFLAVLLPEAKQQESEHVSDAVTNRIDAAGWIGARVECAGQVDLAFFRTAADAVTTVEGFTTDAARFTASFDEKGRLLDIYFEGSAFSGYGLDVKSDQTVTCAVAPRASGTELEVKADQAGSLTLKAERKPYKVLLSGSAVDTWSYDEQTKTLKIQLPEGMNTFSIQ